MRQTLGKLLRTAALGAIWSLSATGIAQQSTQPANAQVFNPKYNKTLTVLKEIEENCNLSDAELALSMQRHLNDFIREAKAAGTPDLVTEPVGVEVFHSALMAALRKTGYVDLSISTREDVDKGPRFVCQLS